MANQSIQIGAHEFVLRPPTDVEFYRFVDLARQRGGRGRAASFLTLSCLVSPGHAEAQAIISDAPALKHKLASELEQLAGMHDEAAPPLAPSDDVQAVLAAHPRAVAVQLGERVYVYRAPGEEVFDDFIAASSSEPAGALANLVRACVLYPAAAELEQALGARPGHVILLGGFVQRAAGADLEVVRGKPATC